MRPELDGMAALKVEDYVELMGLLDDDETEVGVVTVDSSVTDEVEVKRVERRAVLRTQDPEEQEIEMLEQSVAELKRETGQLATELESTTKMMMDLRNQRKQRIFHFKDLMNTDGATNAPAIIEESCSENVTMTNPYLQQEVVGRAALARYLELLFESFPDGAFGILEMEPRGRNGLSVTFTFQGTQMEPFGGVPVINKEVKITGHVLITFEASNTSLLVDSMHWTWNVTEGILSLMGLKPETLPRNKAQQRSQV